MPHIDYAKLHARNGVPLPWLKSFMEPIITWLCSDKPRQPITQAEKDIAEHGEIGAVMLTRLRADK